MPAIKRNKIAIPQTTIKPEEKAVKKFKVVNLIEAHQPVPYKDKDGKTRYLNLRIQGRGGQTPPVLSETALHTGMDKLVKKGYIKLVEV